MNHSKTTLLAVCVLIACSGGGRHKEWEDLDYSRVYKHYGERENDPGYTQPSILNCVNDDLYNCNP